MEEPVENGGGNHGIAEDFSPSSEALIASKDNGSLLVAAGDELEEEISAMAIDGDIADLVNNQELA
jgi:hypothetical protein